jgi:hypothetical protein
MSRPILGVTSVLIGSALALILIWCWAYIAAYNPLPSLLLGTGLRGSVFLAGLAAADFLINLCLCLPAAWALWRLGRKYVRSNTLLALVAYVVVGWIAVGLPLFSYGAKVVIPYILQLAALPVAVWLVIKFTRDAPNNSFKPTPLRGAA